MDNRHAAAMLLLSLVATVGHAYEEGNMAPADLDAHDLGDSSAVDEHHGTRGAVQELGQESDRGEKLAELQGKHVEFMKLLATAQTSYCKEDAGVFCQLIKGLRRKYVSAVKTEDDKDYKDYVLQLNIRYCTGPHKNLNSRRCKLIPTFLDGIPKVKAAMMDGKIGNAVISEGAQAAYASQKDAYNQKLRGMTEHYCDKDDATLCKEMRSLEQKYGTASAKNDISQFRVAFNAVHSQYCQRDVDKLTERCQKFAKLMKIPASMEPLDTEPRIDIDVSKLNSAQKKYDAHLSNMQSKECDGGNNALFCEMVVGVRQSFAASLDGTPDAHIKYVKNLEGDVCGKDKGSQRCSTAKRLLAEMPGGTAETQPIAQSAGPDTPEPEKTAAKSQKTPAQSVPEKPAAKSQKTLGPKKMAKKEEGQKTQVADQNAPEKTAAKSQKTPAQSVPEKPAAKSQKTPGPKKMAKKEEGQKTQVADQNAPVSKESSYSSTSVPMYSSAATPAGQKTEVADQSTPKAPKASPSKEDIDAVREMATAYKKNISKSVSRSCEGQDKDFCDEVKGIQKQFATVQRTCDSAKFAKHLTEMQIKYCKAGAAKERCNMFQELQVRLPVMICDKKDMSSVTSEDHEQKPKTPESTTVAPAKDTSHTEDAKAHPAPKTTVAAASPLSQAVATDAATYKSGQPHMFGLTADQKAYQGSLEDITKEYCVTNKSPFCKQTKALQKMFDSALAQQFSEPFEKHLKTLTATFCQTAPEQATKRCHLLKLLSKTMVSVSHMAPNSAKRLSDLQRDYVQETKRAEDHYCSADESSMICEVCRGLGREYERSLKDKTNIQYAKYLSNVEHQLCGSPAQQSESYCKLFPELHKSMPISEFTMKTLPEKHLEYLNTVNDVSNHFCAKETDTSLICELSYGIKRVYVAALNSEDNSGFYVYLSRIQDDFCTNPAPEDLKACKILPVLKSGVPPSFLAEGVHRLIDSTNARARIDAAQSELREQLQKDRIEYSKSLHHVYKHYCSSEDSSHPTYICMLMDGLVKNYEYSLHKSKENWEFKHYLKHLKQDFCVKGAEEGYDKRCRVIPMLENGLPMSGNDETRLYHEQNEFLKATQDVVGHFCFEMTPSAFCQLAHGFVRQYIRAVAAHENTNFLSYLGNMENHFCAGDSDKNAQKCKMFPVLRKGIPGSGLGAREALNSAAAAVEKAKAELRAARRIRNLAQTSVKGNPTKVNLASLEQATANELKVEKILHDAQIEEVHKLAEKSGAPSQDDVKRAMDRAKEMQALAVKANEAAVAAKRRSEQMVTAAKAKVLQTTMKLSKSTDAVKVSTTPASVKAVENAMHASAAAKKQLKQVKSAADQTVEEARRAAEAAADRAVASKKRSIKMSATQKKIFAQFAMRAAQKSAEKADEANEFTQANAKQAAQKLWWARVYAKENPTKENQLAVEQAAHAAERAGRLVEAVAAHSVRLDQEAHTAAMKLDEVNDSMSSTDKAANAHLAVKEAQQAAQRAQKQAGKEAAKLKGPVAKQLVDESRAKATKLCGAAQMKEGKMHKAKVDLDAAGAELRASPSDANVKKIQTVSKAYKAAKNEVHAAKALCKHAQGFADKLEAGADVSGKSSGAASAAKVVQATEDAAKASAAVEKAKEQEKQEVEAHLAGLKQQYTTALDAAQVAHANAARADRLVASLTTMVANHPSEQNIASLKKALVDKKKTAAKKVMADKKAKSAYDMQKSGMAKAVESTASPALKKELSARLHEQRLAGLSAAKEKLAGAVAASKKAAATAKAKPTPANKVVEKKAADAVKALRAEVAAAGEAAASAVSMDESHKSIEDVKASLQQATRKKEAAKQVAMADPTNENLKAFRDQIRKVHDLQNTLITAKQQKALMSAPGTKSQGSMVSSMLKYYCANDKYQNVCKFYNGLTESRDSTESRMGKHLLAKVAESRSHIEHIKTKVRDAETQAAADPTKTNKDQVKALTLRLATATKSYQQSEKMVQEFMTHQSALGQKMKPGASKVELSQKISELINFYCSHNKYEKLCTFYKQLQDKHKPKLR